MPLRYHCQQRQNAKPRINILVDKQGKPVINVLDEKGKVVKSLVDLK